MTTTAPAPTQAAAGIDPRGPQFAAGLTAVVLARRAAVLPSPWALVLAALQAVLFAIGARPRRAAHARSRGCSAPWSGRGSRPPAELEDPAPPRFAQARRPGVRARRGHRLRRPAPTLLAQVALGFALVAAAAQRGLPVLPGLRDVPAPQADRRG